jgi:uracil-DNA glycosylase family 4
MDMAMAGSLSVLFDEAQQCTRCPTMAGRSRVLGAGNGTEKARCLMVAEAPGRQGASKTGVPLHGDRVGKNFERLLRESGIDREELFITNAVLCCPQTQAGRSRHPSRAEISTCSHFLAELIDRLDPAIVVTLGTVALSAVEEIESHGMQLKWAAGKVQRWNGRFLLPLYHPGSRAMINRPWAQQKQDYALLRSLL